MHPMTVRLPPFSAGFTLVEMMVALAVFAILLAVGVPNMSSWLGATSATNASQFYADGFALARSQALANNSRSRLVLSENEQSGQLDWQVDVCFPDASDGCAAGSARWSSPDKAAAAPEGGDVQTKSVFRSASALPKAAALAITSDNDDADGVYFTPLGWIDTGKPAVTRLELAPVGDSKAFAPSAVVVTLAGAVLTCRPGADAGDSRKCP